MDIFDEIAGNTEDVQTPIPIADPTQFQTPIPQQATETIAPQVSNAPDIFDEIAGNVSDSGAIKAAGLKGLGTPFSILDELLPGFSPNAGNMLKAVPPHLWGLFGTQKPAASFAQDYASLVPDSTSTIKPESEFGKLGADVAENAGAAAGFGPIPALLNGVLGGGGAYGGEKIGDAAGYPQLGKTVGSFLGGASPAAIGKIGIVKEVGEQLGPLMSQLPGLSKWLGIVPLEAAAGRGIAKQATDLPQLEQSLSDINNFVGPKTQTDALKTVDELTGDIGVARTTDAVENSVANAGFKQIGEERAAVREANVLGTEPKFDPSTTKYTLSKDAEDALSTSVDNFEKHFETPAWEKLPKDQQLVADHLDGDLAAGIDNITYDGVHALEGRGAGLMSQFKKAITENNGILNFGQLQKFRQKALQLGRKAKSDLTAEGSQARDVSALLESHIRDIVDSNASAGVLPSNVVKDWETARGLTNKKFTTLSADKDGTKILQDLTLKDKALDNTRLIDEAIKSPDKLDSHLAAASLGGADTLEGLKSAYRQGLLQKLDGIKQSKWAETIADNRQVWEKVFTPEELKNIERNTDDVASMLANERNRVTTGSGTNTRGKIQNSLDAEKGLAGTLSDSKIGGLLNAGITGGAAYEGGKKGWDSAETRSGKIVRGLLGAVLGATAGKSIKSAASNASSGIDNLLVEGLKDPATMARLLKAAKPSRFGQKLVGALVDTAGAATAKVAGDSLSNLVNKTIGNPVNPISAPISSLLQSTTGQQMSTPINKDEFNSKLDSVAKNLGAKSEDLKQVIKFETGNTFDSSVKNKAGSGATGLIQFMPDTAKAITGKDSKEAAVKFLESMTPTQQLDYVEKYLAPFKGKINSLDDLYMAVLYPVAVGKSDDFPLFSKFKTASKAYWQNKGLDLNQNGIITKAEAAQLVKDYNA